MPVPGEKSFWGAHSPKSSGTASPQSWLHPGWGAKTSSRIPTSFAPSPQDKADIESLLSPENVNRDALLSYAKEAANFSTNYRLPELEFALNHRDLPDVDMFDFTCMTRSENAALVREHNGARLLLGLVGDCLVEVRVPRAAPLCASVSPLPARCIGCNTFPLPKRFSPQLPGAPHPREQAPQVPVAGCFGGVIPFPSPTGDLEWFQGRGTAQLLPRRSRTSWGGVSHPSSPCASCRRSPLSSPAKPGSSQPPPSRPDRPCGSNSISLCLCLCSPSGRWAPAWPGAFSPPSMRRGWCGGGRPGRLRWRCWPRGECPSPAGLVPEWARMVALSPALSLVPRESIYQHLSQTSPDNTNKNISQYSIDPATRYPNINLQAIKASQVPGQVLPWGSHPAQPPQQSG